MTNKTNIYLTTEHYQLRNWQDSDLSDLVALDTDPKVMYYLSGVQPGALENIRDNVFPTVRGYEKRYDGRLGNWIAEDRNTHEFIGWFHLRPDKRNLEDESRLELRYRLKQKFWGKGVATEISSALVQAAWSLGAKEIFARAQIRNRASSRVMEKCGMLFDCVYTEPEIGYSDKTAVRYTILNPSQT